ncbi:hypothetical protein PG991_009137 [Apiospora marii]|uniref:Uncharacterized protein n=1 Tax=Apiospora marii TaxID=335849 RepID=A0ABR1RJU9_9PEZI
MFQPRRKARQPIASGVQRSRQVRGPHYAVQRNFTFPAAATATFQPLPAARSLQQNDFNLSGTPDHSTAVAGAIAHLSSKIDEQIVQVKQLGQSVDAVKQVVDDGFETLNRKVDDWLTRLDDVIEQDSVAKSADELLEEEFLALG